MKKCRRLVAGCTVLVSLLMTNQVGVNAEWKNDANGWWYSEGNSWKSGWGNINNNWYYFNSDGYMAHDTIIDGYYLNSNGVGTKILSTIRPTWESGGINLTTGLDADYNYCIRTSMFTVDKDTEFKINGVKAGKAICVFEYDSNGNMIRNSGYSDKTYTLSSGKNYRIVFGYSNGNIDASNVEKTKNNVVLLQSKYGHYGNVMNILGDSFTDATFQGQYTKYYEQIKKILGIKTINNYGQGGTCIAKGDSNNNSFIDRYNSMSKNADIVLVFGGTNDWGKHKKLGTIYSTDDTTFYGAMNELCDRLIADYPNKNIVFVTPIMRLSAADGLTESLPANEQKNNLGLKLEDYVNAMIQVCDMHAIPICDLYHNSGLNPVNRQSSLYLNYYADGIHPNNKGYEIIGEEISDFIQSQI